MPTSSPRPPQPFAPGTSQPRNNPTPRQRFKREFTYGQALAWIFKIGLPAVGIIWSGLEVFKDAKLISITLVLVTVGASILLTFYSSDKSQRIRRFCIVAEGVLSLVMWMNLGVHFYIGREVSAANSGVAEANEQADLDAERAIKLANADTEKAKAEAQRAQAERDRLRQLPRAQRRSTLRTDTNTRATLTATPDAKKAKEAEQVEEELSPKLTPDQVRRKYSFLAWFFAFLEAGIAIGALAIMGAMYHWDMSTDQDGNGVPDWVERELSWEEISERYPHHYATLIEQQQSVGNSQLQAQVEQMVAQMLANAQNGGPGRAPRPSRRVKDELGK